MRKGVDTKSIVFNASMSAVYGDDWKSKIRYYGGDWDRHLRYLVVTQRPGDVLPGRRDQCHCHTSINRQAYVIDPETRHIEVVGSCCIENFTEFGLRRQCEVCDAVHQSQYKSGNVCPSCRKERAKAAKIAEKLEKERRQTEAWESILRDGREAAADRKTEKILLEGAQEAIEDALFWMQYYNAPWELRKARECVDMILKDPKEYPNAPHMIRDFAKKRILSPKQIRVCARVAKCQELEDFIEGKCNY